MGFHKALSRIQVVPRIRIARKVHMLAASGYVCIYRYKDTKAKKKKTGGLIPVGKKTGDRLKASELLTGCDKES